MLKKMRFNSGEPTHANLYATILIIFAAGLRILLIALGWPPTNSDEGTMGVMAMNIAYHGAHPFIYYGQTYMGVIEAYLGAFFFHLFGGPSLFALRLGVVLMVTLFLICLYLLGSLLFSRGLALITIGLLSIGSIPFLTRQTIATGGSSQTLLFGALTFLLVTWLALTYRRGASLNTKVKRAATYALLGLVIGLALWSDMVVLPFIAMAVLLLLLFCWRELLFGASLLVGLCALLGVMPLLRYDFARGLTPWQVLLGLARGTNATAPVTLPSILHNIKNTTLIGIPTATGSPFCPVNELRFEGDNAPHTLACTFTHASWGGGYLLLLAIALFSTLLALWHLRIQRHTVDTHDWRQYSIRRIAQLCLLGGAGLAIGVFMTSSGPVDMPAFHARYLITLLIATPALLEPLWIAARASASLLARPGRTRVYISRAILLLIFCMLLGGTLVAFNEVPAVQATNQQRTDLVNKLIHIHATHIYTEYWTCNNVAFASHEQVICAVLDQNLQPTHNRAPGYYEIVHADAHAAYVFPASAGDLPASSNGLPAIERMVAQAPPGSYRRYEIAGYIIYQPILDPAQAATPGAERK